MKQLNTKSLFIIAALACGHASAGDPSIDCFAELSNAQEYSWLSTKMSLLNAKQQTFQMLVDESRPSEDEKPLILSWATAREKCMQLGEEWRAANLPPPAQALIRNNFNDAMTLTADLYSGKITYGQYAKERQASSDRFSTSMSALRQNLIDKQEAARRQAAAAALSSFKPYQAPQLTPYQMPTPSTTNCNMVGNQVSCTTR